MICDVPYETKTLCCFATYNANNELAQYKIDYINELSRHFQHVVISTSDIVINRNELMPNTSFNYTENKGLDFGLHWNVFIKIISSDSYNFEKIGLVNDSCMMINKLDGIFEWGRNYNFWGITLSYDYDVHIQSYFLIFKGENAISSLFEFIKNNDIYKCKTRKQIIANFEIGLSQYMKKKDIHLYALYDQPFIYKSDSRARKTESLNPSFHQWNSLISLGCPLIKISRAKFAGDIDFINKIKQDIAENKIKLVAINSKSNEPVKPVEPKLTKLFEPKHQLVTTLTMKLQEQQNKKITDLTLRKKQINEMFRQKYLVC